MHVRTSAAELARWLELEGGLWHVEGEPVLARSLPLPAPAVSLVEALRKSGGSVTVLAPDDSPVAQDGLEVSADNLSFMAHVIDGQRVFQLAWIRPDGTVADSWLLVEQDARSGRADSGAAARGVFARFRAARVTTSRR
jgi:hypothetical protein